MRFKACPIPTGTESHKSSNVSLDKVNCSFGKETHGRRNPGEGEKPGLSQAGNLGGVRLQENAAVRKGGVAALKAYRGILTVSDPALTFSRRRQ
jgi:hypothetical protein